MVPSGAEPRAESKCRVFDQFQVRRKMKILAVSMIEGVVKLSTFPTLVNLADCGHINDANTPLHSLYYK